MSVSAEPLPSTSDQKSGNAPIPVTLIYPRREPFEYGLLPIPKLIFTDTVQALTVLKQQISSAGNRVNSSILADALQISVERSRVVLDTLASVLHFDSDPLAKAAPNDIDSVGADWRDLVLFLYIQPYKKLLSRTHKDSASVADVWPSTSAFDGCLSALSPMQLVRSNSRRFMPTQADEEAHQLSYLQKHLANILSLLAEPVEGEGEESLVMTMEGFQHLGFLFHFGDKVFDGVPLSQATPFFSNTDSDMHATRVPATQLHDWISQNIDASLEHITEKICIKDASTSSQDAPSADVGMTSVRASTRTRAPCYIEGISKLSYVKQASDINGSSLKVLNCHESVIYILAPLKYATVYGCSDATIVLGAVGKAVKVEHCERVHIITAAKRICISNCRECVFFLGVNQRPLLIGDNHKLQVAPFNTFYSKLEEHMSEVGIDRAINRWDEFFALGGVDPHDSSSHPAAAGVLDVHPECGIRLNPDQFTTFLIPNWFDSESHGSTKVNPFQLPEAYMSAQQRNLNNLGEINLQLKESPLEENRKRELSYALHILFKDWLYTSGNIRQLYCLQGD